MSDLFQNDKANYRAMSEPYENVEKTNEATEGFHKELSALRRKYKVRDLVYVMGGSYKASDGEEAEFLIPGMFGASDRAETMAAWLLGHEQKTREERVDKALASCPTRRRGQRDE